MWQGLQSAHEQWPPLCPAASARGLNRGPVGGIQGRSPALLATGRQRKVSYPEGYQSLSGHACSEPIMAWKLGNSRSQAKLALKLRSLTCTGVSGPVLPRPHHLLPVLPSSELCLGKLEPIPFPLCPLGPVADSGQNLLSQCWGRGRGICPGHPCPFGPGGVQKKGPLLWAARDKGRGEIHICTHTHVCTHKF